MSIKTQADSKRRVFLFTVICLLAATALLLPSGVRETSDVERLKYWFMEFEWMAPLVFIAILTLRPLLMIPSTILLIVGGLCFGTLIGGTLGTLGLCFTAGLFFVSLRNFKPARTWIYDTQSVKLLNRWSEYSVLFLTAIPPLPMTAVHCAAALSDITFFRFFSLVVLGAIIRAFPLAYFGASIGVGSKEHVIVSCTAVCILICFAQPVLYLVKQRESADSD